MADTRTTLLMKFEADGGPIKAECPLLIDSGDTLAMKLIVMQASRVEVPGFRLVTQGQLPRYFLISEFSFSASLSDSEADGDDGNKPDAETDAGGVGGARGRGTNDAARGHRHSAGGLGLGHRDDSRGSKTADAKGSDKGSAGSSPVASGSFSRWRSSKDDPSKPPSKKPNNSPDQMFPSRIDSFTFTRRVDCSTPTLLKACCDGTTFKSASLIKRKPARGSIAADLADMSFIRIDFAGVKITGLKFSDGDVVTETCTFICDAMQIIYSQQDASGKLSPMPPVSWQNPVADTKGRGSGA